MREIGAAEAGNTLGALLDLVQQGEHVVITRHGKPVARLVPETVARDRNVGKAAVERIRARIRTRIIAPVSVEEWKDFRDEGRA
jgi:prevent-host-death family protein